MKTKYRYRFPIRVSMWRWGITIAWEQPIVKMDDGSISQFFDMFDD
jgi:hypothetical protein